MLTALAFAAVLSTQESKANNVANDDREILIVAFRDRSRTRYLGRKYWSERGSFKARIQRLVKNMEPSTEKALLAGNRENLKVRPEWDTLCNIQKHIKDDIEKAPPAVVPILELGLSSDIRITVHDPDLYLKDQDKYSSEITAWMRETPIIDYPTPPAYSVSGLYAILSYRFSDFRHGWFTTIVLEKSKGAWRVILKTPTSWGRRD